MNTSLQLRTGQNLSITPQMQQAIRLLQLSSIELQDEIQQALDTNPLLEVEETFTFKNDENQEGVGDEQDGLERSDIPDELPTDSEWSDTFDNAAPIAASSRQSDDYGEYTAQSDDLHSHLRWQMTLTPFSDYEQAIALVVIDAINQDGYLTASISDIEQSLLDDDSRAIAADDIENVIVRIQQFDPIGVGARTLRECLLIQIKQLNSRHLKHLTALVDNHLEALASHDTATIKKALAIDDDTLHDLITLIKTLNPRPGSQLNADTADYITPDVYVRKLYGEWQLSLNAQHIPRLKIADHYARLVKRADNSSDNVYLKNNLREARWLLKSLQNRCDTLLKVATAIVKYQQDFLEKGDEAMKPLLLQDIAAQIDMHESTVSRATKGKYLHTPRGIYELKHFFSNSVSYTNESENGQHSTTAIRAVIKRLVAEENPHKPLSDSNIANLLGEKKINIARRTIAKYRDMLAIPTASKRKRLG